MNRGAEMLLAPIVALALLAFVLVATIGALRASGTFGTNSPFTVRKVEDPFLQLDRRLAAAAVSGDAVVRDPFGFGTVAVANPVTPRVHKPVVPATPPVPVLTAIVYDADPRAIVRWQGREWTIRSGVLFDEFQVVSITRDQVTLKRGEVPIVLQRKPQGE